MPHSASLYRFGRCPHPYSAIFEKVFTLRTQGLHFQPVPPKVHPVAPREVHGCSQFWKRAGSEFPAFGVWLLGLRPADSGGWGHNERVPVTVRRKGNRRKPGSGHGPRGPQGPKGIPPGHPCCWFSLDTFSEPPQTRLGPWPPRSPGPLGHPSWPSLSLI